MFDPDLHWDEYWDAMAHKHNKEYESVKAFVTHWNETRSLTCPYQCEWKWYFGKLCIGAPTNPHPTARLCRTSATK